VRVARRCEIGNCSARCRRRNHRGSTTSRSDSRARSAPRSLLSPSAPASDCRPGRRRAPRLSARARSPRAPCSADSGSCAPSSAAEALSGTPLRRHVSGPGAPSVTPRIGSTNPRLFKSLRKSRLAVSSFVPGARPSSTLCPVSVMPQAASTASRGWPRCSFSATSRRVCLPRTRARHGVRSQRHNSGTLRASKPQQSATDCNATFGDSPYRDLLRIAATSCRTLVASALKSLGRKAVPVGVRPRAP
jgi:hypothetical protein